MFKEITNRDAWSTIRGFVYQVDITMLRWLNLAEDETLELEKGEDIDIIKNSLESDDNSRILEQIKYREGTVSLNTELALELLFNFFLHQQNNPGQKLLFRFVSNAGYNIERPALFPKGKTGISVWQELYNDENAISDDKRLQIIQKHFLTKINKKLTAPSNTEENDKELQQKWIDFKALVENQIALLQFIKNFEWSLESPESTKVSTNVKELIATSPHFPVRIDSELLYPRLFLYVFRLLTNSATKSLNIADLKEQSKLLPLNTEDAAAFQLVSGLLNHLEERVSGIETTVATSIKKIDALTQDVHSIKSSDAVFEVRLRNLSSTPPAVLRNGSVRKDKTAEILASFDNTPWINFQGINGTGKTQLAVLTSKLFENIHWIELREYNNSLEKSTLLVEALLSEISGIPLIIDRDKWITSVLEKLPPKTIIVINDLPQISSNSLLNELLIQLGTNIEKKQISLLTTSNYKIPTSLLGSLPQNSFKEYYDFSLKDDEIKEILINNDATEGILKFVSLFASVSHRNPRVLLAIINRLKIMNWGTDSSEVFEVLFNKEFSAEILKDAQSSITHFITDSHMRELLYRLTLIHYDYTFDVIQAVSDVGEKVVSPYEKLQGIANIWIEETGAIYKTSPIIHDLGIANLNIETTKSVYSALAHSILEKKNVNVITASRIITAFIKGEDFNAACIILLNVLRSAQTDDAAKNLYEWGYLDYWSVSKLPDSMANILKTQLTVEQIRLQKIIQKDTKIYTNRVHKFTLETNDLSEKILIHTILLGTGTLENPQDFMTSAKYVLENASNLPDFIKAAITPELLEGFLWMPIQQLSEEEDFQFWFELVEIFEKQTGLNYFKNEMAEVGVSVLVNNIVKNEKQNTQFEPTRLAKRLDDLIIYFQDKNFEIFTAIILKERIALEFQINNRVALSEEMTIEWSEKFTSSEAKYLLYENLGKLYFNDNHNPKNIIWLENAIKYNCENNATFVDTLVYGAASVSDSNSGKAVSYMERAVELMKKTSWSSDLDIIQMISELGISYWKNGEFEKSYKTFNDAMTRLQATKSASFGAEWIRILSWMAHTLGYISAEVSKDKVPLYFTNGADYTKPYQGIFVFNTKDLSDLYTSNKDILMLAQMAIFSEGIGDIEGAYKWSLRAFDEARKTGDQSLIMMVSIACSQYSLIVFKIQEHFEFALQFHAISAHLNGTPEEKYATASKLSYEDLVANKPSKEWDSAEETLFSLSIIPMLIMVLNTYNSSTSGKSHSCELLNLIKNYGEEASDKSLWQNAFELMSKILENKITPDALIKEANLYGEINNKNFQTICILGYIFIEKNNTNCLLQIINVFPHLTKILSNQPAILRNILVPFVKFYVCESVKETYVGSKKELDEIIEEIHTAGSATRNAVQKLLHPAVEICELKVTGDRNEWLFQYKEI